MTWTGALHWTYGARAWWGAAVSLYDGRLYLRHELTWIRTPPDVAAKDILALIAREGFATFTGTVAQPEIWPSDRDVPGVSVSETFSRAGVRLIQGSKDRINGWSTLRSWLAPRPFTGADGIAFVSPSLVIHPSCERFLRTITTLVADPTNADDVEDSPDANPASAMRRLVMSRPLPSLHATVTLPEGAIGHEVNKIRAALAAKGGRV